MNIIEYTESDMKLFEIYMHRLMYILAMDASCLIEVHHFSLHGSKNTCAKERFCFRSAIMPKIIDIKL